MSNPSSPQSPRKDPPGPWWIENKAASFLIGNAMLFGSLWLIWTVWDYFSEKDMEKYQYDFYFVVAGKSDGQPFYINQIVRCALGRSSTGTPLSGIYQYTTTPKYTGQRLPDGSVIYFNVPPACNFNLKSGRWKMPGRHDIVPAGRWIDSESNPGLMEIYIGPGYFDQSGARVTLSESYLDFPLPHMTMDEWPERPVALAWRSDSESEIMLPEARERIKESGGWKHLALRPVNGATPIPETIINTVIENPVYHESENERLRIYRSTQTFVNWVENEEIDKAVAFYRSGVLTGDPLNPPPFMRGGVHKELRDQGAEIVSFTYPLRFIEPKRFIGSFINDRKRYLSLQPIREISEYVYYSDNFQNENLTIEIDGDSMEISPSLLLGSKILIFDSRTKLLYRFTWI
jgi:hypothetical protein